MRPRNMESLEYDDEDQIDLATPALGKPQFPYGMRLAFDDRTIKKLDIDLDEYKEGDEVEMEFRGKVTVVHAEDGMNRLEVQLTHVCLEDESAEGEEEEE